MQESILNSIISIFSAIIGVFVGYFLNCCTVRYQEKKNKKKKEKVGTVDIYCQEDIS